MTKRPPPRSRAGSSVTCLLLGALAAATVFGPSVERGAAAQSISDRRDQPTPASLPDGDKGERYSADKPTGGVAPPSAIANSTTVTDLGDKPLDRRSLDRRGKTTYTNPLDHLPASDRAAMSGKRE